ncbi:MAG: 30S ribosomal protein S12 methylthiotransferase RimO [Rikenellaceae bacterium]
MKNINIITLGCAKNRVDSEHIAHALSLGYEIIYDEDILTEDDVLFDSKTHYDVVVINTCGFILDAKTESIEMILVASAAKARGQIDKLYVIGCLSQRYGDDLRNEIPEVDSYFGARDFTELLDILEGDSSLEGRTISTPEHYAYLKVSEGCNWMCGYCAIPLIRGRHRSVPMEKLLSEAQYLAETGVKELIVIAQDTTYYGMDLYGERRLAQLLEELCKIEGIEWIRLQYAYPTGFPRDVIEVMAREEKICKYLDIPFQHIADNVLDTMRRRISKEETLQLIKELREAMPTIAIRTTMLVGYPTETEEDFDELYNFVKEARIERLGVFPYSEEEGTYSAQTFEDNIPQEVKEQRADDIMALQERISQSISESRIGMRLRVLFDDAMDEYFVGRTEWDTPEVDGEVLVAIPKDMTDDEVDSMIGKFYYVDITGAISHDLYGQLSDKQQ